MEKSQPVHEQSKDLTEVFDLKAEGLFQGLAENNFGKSLILLENPSDPRGNEFARIIATHSNEPQYLYVVVPPSDSTNGEIFEFHAPGTYQVLPITDANLGILVAPEPDSLDPHSAEFEDFLREALNLPVVTILRLSSAPVRELEFASERIEASTRMAELAFKNRMEAMSKIPSSLL